jgi:ATP-dependent phosphoenolpyruvate carboxykinase
MSNSMGGTMNEEIPQEQGEATSDAEARSELADDQLEAVTGGTAGALAVRTGAGAGREEKDKAVTFTAIALAESSGD